MNHTSRKASAVGLTAALMLLVVGCTSDPKPTQTSQPVDVTFKKVDAAAWSDTTARVSDFTAVPGVNGTPRLTVASVGASDQVRHVTVWAAGDGQTTGEPTTLTGVTGDVTSVAADGTAALTAIGGTTWQDGQYSSYLVTSPDRTTWTPVALPDNVSASRIKQVAVPNPQTVVVAGNGYLGRAQQVSVLNIDTNTWTTSELPAPNDTSTQVITGLDASPKQIIVTMSTGPEGGLSTPVSFVSSDDGATFAGPNTIAPEGSSVAGVVWAARTFVATGGLRGDDGNRQPTAWTSADGVTWTTEAGAGVKSSAGDTPLVNIDAAYSRPIESSGLTAVGASGTQLATIWFTGRNADGTWLKYAGGTNDVLVNNPPSLTVPDNGNQFVVVSGGFNGLREARWNDSKQAYDVTDLIVATSPFRMDSAEPGDGSINLFGSARRFARAGDRWKNTSTLKIGQFTSDGVSDVAWGPDALASSMMAKSAADSETGTTVVAAMNDVGNDFPGVAWFKRSGGEWESATGFDGGKFRAVTAVKHLDTGWFLAAEDAPDATFVTVRPVTIWTSSDGVVWTPTAAGLNAEGAHDALVNDLCSDGKRTVAVGYTSTLAGVSTAAWWYSDGGEWTRGALDTAGSGFTSCEATDGTFLVTGTINGRTATWTSKDLKEFTSHGVVDRGLYRDDPAHAGDRWVAGGSVETADYSGPVLWVSQDGVQWSWTRVPVDTESSSATVQAAGDVVAVMVNTLDGVQMWRVTMS